MRIQVVAVSTERARSCIQTLLTASSAGLTSESCGIVVEVCIGTLIQTATLSQLLVGRTLGAHRRVWAPTVVALARTGKTACSEFIAIVLFWTRIVADGVKDEGLFWTGETMAARAIAGSAVGVAVLTDVAAASQIEALITLGLAEIRAGLSNQVGGTRSKTGLSIEVEAIFTTVAVLAVLAHSAIGCAGGTAIQLLYE